uniref:Uncharacterized protein n=1 Tax=Rhizophora mucronata TaxID=61149 RepID=A0A2P2PWY7_RHIMU
MSERISQKVIRNTSNCMNCEHRI